MIKLEEIVARYYAAFNARDLESYARLFTPDAEMVAPGVSARGLEAIRAFDLGWQGPFPEARVENFRMLSAGNTLVAGNWFHGGPHRGVLHAPQGDVPPTGKVLSAPYCSMFTFQGERISRQQVMYEPAWVPIQLGLVGA